MESRKLKRSRNTAPHHPHRSRSPSPVKLCCDNHRIMWWEPPHGSLTLDFCRDTSLHGLKYLGQPKRHIIERVFWSIAILAALCIVLYLISDVWNKYQNSPVIVSFEPFETNIDKIPFPAVTVCNMNKVLKSKALEYIRIASKEDVDHSDPEIESNLRNVFYLDHVCSSPRGFAQKFNYSLGRGKVDAELLEKASDHIASSDTGRDDLRVFFEMASQPCTEMIPLCTWKGDIIDCPLIFRPIETDFGKCCTFNMVPQTLLHKFLNDSRDDPKEIEEWRTWNLTSEYDGLLLHEDDDDETDDRSRPRHQIRAGKNFGLSFLLDPDLDEYFCTTSDSTGFRLATHFPNEVPHVIDFGIAVRPKSEVFVDVRPEISLAHSTINGYHLDKRECYFAGEYNLTYYAYYTAGNCIDECIAEGTYQKCQCVRYYMPRDDKRELCGPEDYICTENVKSEFSGQGVKRTCNHCFPLCTEINYINSATTTPLQKNIWSFTDGVPAKWANNSVSIVHVFYSQDSTYARVRKELFGITDLFANVGGLLGLCLGFSGLSLMEFIYFLTLRAWCRERRKKSFRTRVLEQFNDIWGRVYGRGSGGDPEDLDPREMAKLRRAGSLTLLPVVQRGRSWKDYSMSPNTRRRDQFPNGDSIKMAKRMSSLPTTHSNERPPMDSELTKL